ncbi:MAG: hypothetical protein HQK83_04595 [Fibrobacteria bacterium]|nr:hypothetical protein [Fibrobacteria bacterium]
MKQFNHYEAEIVISDGELETSTWIIIEANSLISAEEKAKRIVQNWFSPPFEYFNQWLYFPKFGRSVRVLQLNETTAKKFLRHRTMKVA